MSNSTTNTSSGVIAEPKGRSAVMTFFRRLIKEKPLGTAGGVVIVVLFFTGIFADFLAPYGMNETHMTDTLLPPSAKYWLGTDNLGRDLLTRVIYGARISMIVGLSAATISMIISIVLGIISGYLGGKFDIVVQRFVDALMCFPGLIILIIIMSMTGPGIVNVIVVMGIRLGITGSRILRGATMSIKENVYVEAAVSIGCSTPRILTRHILPNIIAPVIILFSIRVPSMVLTEASLSFLGFGIAPPVPSWGGMLSGVGRNYMYMAPWLVIWPGLALAIAVYGINIFGDAMRDILDPKLRGGAGRYGRSVKKEVEVKSKPS